MKRMELGIRRTAAFCVLLGMFALMLGSVPARADGGNCGADGDNVTWQTTNIDNYGHVRLVISGSGAMANFVSLSAVPWKDWRGMIVEAEIGEGVTTLGALAFYSHSALTSISLPESLTSIGQSALAGTKIESITIPKSLTGITGDAFWECDCLTEINAAPDHPDYRSVDGVLYSKDGTTLISYPNDRHAGLFVVPDTVTSIGDWAMAGPNGIFTLVLQEGVESLGKRAVGCFAIDTVYLPASLTRLTDRSITGSMLKDIYYAGDEAALGSLYCTDHCFESIMYGSDLINIIKWSFDYDKAISVHYGSSYSPESVPAVEEGLLTQKKCGDDVIYKLYGDGTLAVSGSGSMTNDLERSPLGHFAGMVTRAAIGEGVTSICQYFFDHCVQLREAALPQTLKTIGDNAFSHTALVSLDLPENVKSVPSDAFSGCADLVHVGLPEGITSIGQYAFSGCRSLAVLDLPESVSYISGYAFAFCTALEEIVIPEGITKIDGDVFRGSGLKRIYLPATLETVNGYAFINCASLADVYTARTEDWWAETEILDPEGTNITFTNAEKHFGSDDGLEIIGSGDCSSGTDGSVLWSANKRGTLSITGEGTMKDYSSYGAAPWGQLDIHPRHVVFGDGVENVGAYSCQGMKSVRLGEGIRSIGTAAFNSGNMTELTIPAGVTSIDRTILAYCYRLKTLVLPGTLTSVCENAFGGQYNQAKPTTVLFGGSEEEWQTVLDGDLSGILKNTEVYYCSFAGLVPRAGTTAPDVTETEEGLFVSVKTYLDPGFSGARVFFAQYGAEGAMTGVEITALEAGWGSYASPVFGEDAGMCRLFFLSSGFMPLCRCVTVGG